MDKKRYIQLILLLGLGYAVNILYVYYFPKNFVIDFFFLLSLVAILKWLDFDHKVILVYGLLILVTAPVLYMAKRILLSSRFAIYILYILIAMSIVYIYDRRLDKRIRRAYRKKVYMYFSVFFIIAFILSVTLINFGDLKIMASSTFDRQTYFSQIDKVSINGREYEKNIMYSIDTPGSHSLVKGVIEVSGWVIDRSELEDSRIDSVNIYVGGEPLKGGKLIARCTYGWARPDARYIHNMDDLNTGYSCLLDTSSLENGVNLFYIVFHSTRFQSTIAELKLFVSN